MILTSNREKGPERLVDPSSTARTLIDLPPPLLRCLLSARLPASAKAEGARRAMERTNVDWPAVADIVDASGIGPLAITRMQELGIAGLISPATGRAWEADLLHAQLQCTLQRRDGIRITQKLTECGIRHAFIKGFAVREWLYEPTWVRASADSDILVDPYDVEATRAAIYELDFVQASRSEDFRHFRPATPEEIAETEARHYELAQFARVLRLMNPPEWLFGPDFRRQAPSAFEMLPDGPVLNSVIDVHWALHFLFAEDKPLDSLVTVPSSYGEFEIPTLSVEWHVLYTAFKLYFEAFDRPGWGLYMLADLAALLQEVGNAINWEWLEVQATQKDLEAMLFYTLSAAERLLGAPVVPNEILERLSTADVDRTQGQESTLDFGDFMPYVLRRRLPSAFLEKGVSI
ncbi:MAG: nucleotidyltransferase family protein [Gammaproteobacteria bacterium]